MGIIVFCYLLGFAMLYLGLAQSVSQGLFFGIILLIVATLWLSKELVHRNNQKKIHNK